jgi:hypothetical protein
MSTISKNAVSNGLVGSTVTINSGTSHPGYGAIPPTPLTTSALNTLQQVYTTNTTGHFLTSGSNGTTWTNPNSDVMRINQTDPPSIEVKGRMVINGVDLEERLATIEKVLSIPERDVKLEKKHPNLKRLYDEYITALGKYRTFEAIKGE